MQEFNIPQHLKKYIVKQNYQSYTPVDHSVWRYILRQLRAYLSKNAHEFYLEGLEKTGIDVEKIPSIQDISHKIEKFGWRALPVSGFIPPAAFMELQSLNILPIASDIRSLENLSYTPAPDIVHEAAGHAPFLAHQEFANYLKSYAQVAKKAIISKEDLEQYEAIRELSDIKENPNSNLEQIKRAELKLADINHRISHISEASELSRMNWWTAEYGLIGDLDHPKIFGAGLLSSVGESKWCLSENVKKLPLTVECIHQSYDITTPQPQLFVTPDFKHLTEVLNEMAEKMAFKKGGQFGLDKAIQAQTVNTFELNSGIQVSGQIQEYRISQQGQIAFVKLGGPCQISYEDQQLPGHDKIYHSSGFSTPVGFVEKFPHKCLSEWSETELTQNGFRLKEKISFTMTSGVHVEGVLQNILKKKNKNLLLSFTECTVTWNGQILFDPSWGTFDMTPGFAFTSIFGGPADRDAYGDMDDFVAPRVPTPQYSTKERARQQLFQRVRLWRENSSIQSVLELKKIIEILEKEFPEEWLLRLEILELHPRYLNDGLFKKQVFEQLNKIKIKQPEVQSLIQEGLALIENL